MHHSFVVVFALLLFVSSLKKKKNNNQQPTKLRAGNDETTKRRKVVLSNLSIYLCTTIDLLKNTTFCFSFKTSTQELNNASRKGLTEKRIETTHM